MEIAWISHILPRLLLLTLTTTLYLTPTTALDRSYNRSTIIMITDMDTVLVHTDLTSTRAALNSTKGELARARLGLTVNRLGHFDDKATKHMILGQVLLSLEQEINSSLSRLDTLFDQHQTDYKRQTRAFDFLGDMLSGITGVPSARDHKRLLEGVRLLKLDNEGIRLLMESRNAQQEDVIKTISRQESKLARMNSRLRTAEKFILNHEKEDLQLAGVLALMEKANLAINHANQIYLKISNILMLSDTERLSRFVISKKSLGVILDGITLRRNGGAPVYGRADIEQYYTQKISHSWTIPDLHEIVSLIQIPISPLHGKLELVILDAENIITTDLTMAVVNKQANSFRFLSLADFHRCTSLRGKLICHKRTINILPPMGCSLRIGNCKSWATTVVHDISNTDFLFISENKTVITTTCGNGRINRTYTLPTRATINIPLSCDVTSDTFTIDKSLYGNTMNVDGQRNDINISIKIDPIVLSPSPLKTLTSNIDNNTDMLTKLQKTNERFEQDLETQRQRSDASWANLDSENPDWHSFTNWSLLGTCMTISVLICLWLLRLYCTALKQERGRSKAKELQDGAYNDIVERLRHVETATKLIIQNQERQNT